jgi:small subunit ribosomal protein S18
MRKNNNRNQPNEQRHCWYCVNSVKAIDYKDVPQLRRYTSSFGKIVPRRRSGVCAAHQRMMASAIKNARIMALLPFLIR